MKNLLNSFFLLSALFLFGACSGNKTKKATVEKNATKRVLFVLSSNSDLGTTGKKTGVWLEEFTSPYYALADEGIEITIASPKGGMVSFDPGSLAESASSASTKRYDNDDQLKELLNKSVKLSAIKADNFDAVFIRSDGTVRAEPEEERSRCVLTFDLEGRVVVEAGVSDVVLDADSKMIFCVFFR